MSHGPQSHPIVTILPGGIPITIQRQSLSQGGWRGVFPNQNEMVTEGQLAQRKEIAKFRDIAIKYH